MAGITGRVIFMLRRADWLSRDRVIAWGIMLLAAQVLLLLFIALWQHGVFRRVDTPSSIDFVSFYAAGKLALSGTPALAYDQAAHHLAEQHAAIAATPYQFFFYPPVFLLLCAGLAKMPYLVAYGVFQLVTLAAFILTMRCLLRQSGWRWIPPLLAFPAVVWTIGLGQNAFLTAALFAGFTMLIDKRPIAAGLVLGLLCYKPHFGLLIPIALIAAQRWRTLFAAAASVGALVLLSGLIFGWETWAAYITAFAGSSDVYASGRIDYAGVITPFGAARLLGFGPGPAYVVQGVATASMVCLIALIWRQAVSQPVRNAVLLAATLMAVPVALIYDELLILLAAGWVMREAWTTGYLSWERLGLLAIYPVTLLTWVLGSAWHVPLGPVGPLIILLLCARRIWNASSARDQRALAIGDIQPAGAMP